ncbi:Na+/H+ antiporter NhaA (fragment) [Modestobacter italicus]|uniref:Na+/H+ antiporter NhaA n=1 Tax=Modestobacter italicus (strain DSM 44449 / CECT 9708 / BC 501) TaxID=2732864 RepID=I4F0N9_MODI5
MTSPMRLFARGSWAEVRRITEILHKETVGGALLLAATIIALVWANSPWADSYDALRDVRIGPAALPLDLTLATWAADGLLAIFFSSPDWNSSASSSPATCAIPAAPRCRSPRPSAAWSSRSSSTC